MALRREDIQALTYDELLEHIRLSKVNSDEYEGVITHLKEELEAREPTVNYACAKCGHTKFEERQFRASGGGFSAIFEIQRKSIGS